MEKMIVSEPGTLTIILEVPFAIYTHLTSWWWAVDARNMYRYLKNAFFHLPHVGFTGTNKSHILFLEKDKTEGYNKNDSSFSIYYRSKQQPNNEN
jgi:hypothetical protein